MKSIIKFLLLLSLLSNVSSQPLSFIDERNKISLTGKRDNFKHEFSLSLGMVKSFGEFSGTSLNVSGDLLINIGWGVFISPGFDTFDRTFGGYNHITNINLLLRIGFYIFNRKITLYPGAGGYILFGSEGHPGCCEAGWLFSLRMGYNISDLVVSGVDIRYPTNVGYSTTLISNIFLGIRF